MSLSAVSSYRPSASVDSLVPVLPTENATTAAELNKTQGGKHLTMFAEGDDEPSFWDLLDVINPLQHIPIINNLYREATGDKIGVAARLIGGTLFAGGPIGFATAAANCVLEESTGSDAGGHLLALFRDDEGAEDTGTALAAAPPKAEEAPASAASPKAEKVAAALSEAKAQPLMLDLVGGAAAEPPPPVAAARPAVPAVETVSAAPAPAAPMQVAQAPTSEALAEAAKPAQRGMAIPGRGEGRFMPIPGRTVPLATKSPPPIGTSISTTGYRSNAPIVGHRPDAQRTVNAAAAQQMVAAQAEASTGTAARAPAAGGGDWFSANMMQAMDKYERGNRLSKPAQGSVSEMQ